jgi:NAD(P)-dependent dehydrogenase (short-subunit alcohol dehydrogenase family)
MNLDDNLANPFPTIAGDVGMISSPVSAERQVAGMKIAQQMSQRHDVHVVHVPRNVLCKDSTKHADQQVAAQLGVLSVLVNCAGENSPAAATDTEQIIADLSNPAESFFQFDVKGFRQSLDVNVLETILSCSMENTASINVLGPTEGATT